MKDEATLILIKPDGLKKSLTGNILTRYQKQNLRLWRLRLRGSPKS